MAPGSNFVIAIVDADEAVRRRIEHQLHQGGYRAWGCGSVTELYKKLVAHQVDLILVDINVPGEGVFSLIQHLSVARRYALVVMGTSIEAMEHLRGLAPGVNMLFSTKTADLRDLLACVVVALQQRTEMPLNLRLGVTRSWLLDYGAGTLYAPDGKRLDLTSRELDLLARLMSSSRLMVDKLSISTQSDPSTPDNFHHLDSQLYRLRKKVQNQMGQTLPISSVHGWGIVFNGAAMVINCVNLYSQ